MLIKKFVFNGYPSLLAVTRRTKKPKVLLAAHTDVVSGPEKLFQLRARDGKLYGRGVLDMKFAIVCYMRLVEELGKDIKKYDMGILLTSDEELGGFNGAEQVLKKGYGAEFLFLPDGGLNWEIERGSKGMWLVDFEVRGKTAHAAHPWAGTSAITLFFRFLQDLQRAFKPAIPCDGKTHYHDTITVSRIAGGEATNQVPGKLSASVNIRYIPETSKKDLELRIRNVAKNYKGIAYKGQMHGCAWVTDLSHPFIQSYTAIAKKHGITVGSSFSHGSSDARFFAEHGIPALTVWPKGGGHHGDAEWISTRDFENYYQILREWLDGVAKFK
jgi:succinyl-diaminopimelate desuccinylase